MAVFPVVTIGRSSLKLVAVTWAYLAPVDCHLLSRRWHWTRTVAKGRQSKLWHIDSQRYRCEPKNNKLTQQQIARNQSLKVTEWKKWSRNRREGASGASTVTEGDDNSSVVLYFKKGIIFYNKYIRTRGVW